jgi:hypothetical protein
MTDLDALLARARLTAGHGAPVLLPPAEALALVEEVERLRGDLDFLARAVGQAVVASSLAAGETLAELIPHIIVSTVTRLRAEALGQRADNATVGALAYADGRDDERAAVVAWLRSQVSQAAGDDDYAYEHAADVIERGGHLTGAKP